MARRLAKRAMSSKASAPPSSLGAGSPSLGASAAERFPVDRWLPIFLLTVLVFATLRTFWANLTILRYPYEANFGEGGLLYDALRLRQGKTIYADASSGEWISPYPPLFAWVVSLWPTLDFFWSRLVSQVAHLLSAACLGLVVIRCGAKRTWAAAAALLWLSSPFTRTFAAMGRVDMLGRAFESASLVAGLFWGHAFWGRFLAAALSALGMTTKQTMFVGALALGAWWWGQGRRRQAIEFLSLWAVLTGMAYALVTLLLGPHFIANVFFDVQREFAWVMLPPWLLGFLVSHVGLLVFATMGVRSAWKSATARILVLALLASLPSVFLAAQDGADVNYFFDLHWALCGLAAHGMESLPRWQAWKAMALGAFCTIALLFVELGIPPRAPAADQVAKAQNVRDILAKSAKPVLTEFIGFGLAVGSEPAAVPYLDRKLAETGRRSPAALCERIARGEFGAIMLTSQAPGRWPQFLLDAVERHYRPAHSFAQMFAAEGEPDFIIFVPSR